MRTPRILLAVVVLVAVAPSAAAGFVTGQPLIQRPPSPSGGRAACPTFPADNWLHAAVSKLPVHDRSADWLSHMSTDVDLHPDFGPSYGDGPNYGIPITVVDKTPKKVKVSFSYPAESDKVR